MARKKNKEVVFARFNLRHFQKKNEKETALILLRYLRVSKVLMWFLLIRCQGGKKIEFSLLAL
jgi:hypothetical protein